MTRQDWIAECRKALRYGPELTEEEAIEFRQEKARVRAEDERRRNPQPQLELAP